MSDVGILRFEAIVGLVKTSVEIPADSNLSDTLDAVETFLIAAGFDRQSVQEQIGGGTRGAA